MDKIEKLENQVELYKRGLEMAEDTIQRLDKYIEMLIASK